MNTKFSGGGVLPIVKIEKNGKEILCFITFSSRRGVLSDAGGKCDFGESIEKTCVREFYEESCKLFDINSNQIINQNFIDITAGKTFYRSYFPLIEFDLGVDVFKTNRKCLKSKFHSGYFFEKIEMVIIPIDVELLRLNVYSNKVYTAKDINGESRLVNRRLYKLIKNFRKSEIVPSKLLLEKKQDGDLVTYYTK